MRQLDLFAHTLAPEPTTAPAIPITLEMELLALVNSPLVPLFLFFPLTPFLSPAQRCIPTIAQLEKIIARSLDPPAIPLDPALSHVLAIPDTLAMATTALVTLCFLVSLSPLLLFSSNFSLLFSDFHPAINNCTGVGGGTNNCALIGSTCTNLGPGSFSCTCNTGYNGTGVNCAAINYCAVGETNTCATVGSNCNYTGPGTYTCSCLTGYSGNGQTCTSK